MWCPSKTVFPVLLDNLLVFFVRFFHLKPSSLGNEQKKCSFKNSLVQVEREKRKGGKEWQKIMTHITWCPSNTPAGFQWGSTRHSGVPPSSHTVGSGCFYDYPSDKIHTSPFNPFFTSSLLPILRRPYVLIPILRWHCYDSRVSWGVPRLQTRSYRTEDSDSDSDLPSWIPLRVCRQCGTDEY